MLFGREVRYVLLFSAFAFVVSVIFGLIARLYFFTILFRALVQFVFFFLIGILIEFIYKKYLYDLFKDIRFNSKVDYEYSKGEKRETGTVDMGSSFVGIPVDEKSESGNDFQFMEELEKYSTEHSDSKPKPSSNIQFSDKLSSQLSYLEANDPKVVAKAIKTLINRKE
ncbi:hypothetical protein LKV13_01350 [Borrelia sp. BU AG58]|uniref:hypothetical protein n=1 Tax=Borrelia sp. BU AG58 TaxID=2887345 RepID=UPI001E608CC5|nr:hypothetical protein [Borrelia sp. BU AG58]UER67458.1 hypothetical protein LKV13_01350 [Borrelia sp. BU AG58]